MFLTIVTFLLILSVLIFAHELGHFLVAKKAGIKVEEFGFGLPPRIFGINFKGTIYSLNVLPIGGFVKLAGEDEEEQVNKRVSKQERAKMFWAKPKSVRAAVILAGVLMNFILAVFIFSIIYTKEGIPTETERVRIVGIVPGSPAEQAGIKEGDIVLFASGEKIKDTDEFIRITQKNMGIKIRLEIFREKDNPCQEKVLGATPGIEISCKGQNLELLVVPRLNPPSGEGPLGVAISNVEMLFYPIPQMPIRGAIEGFKEAFAWTKMIAQSLGTIFWQLLTLRRIPEEVAGPVGIFQATGIVAKTGILSTLQFLGVLSINLAVVNILPIPALDGGRLLFIIIEAVIGKRVKADLERLVHTVGMVVLLFLLFLISANDISRILESSNLISRFKTFFSF